VSNLVPRAHVCFGWRWPKGTWALGTRLPCFKPRHACAVKPELRKSWSLEIDYFRAPGLGADQKTRGLWERDWDVSLKSLAFAHNPSLVSHLGKTALSRNFNKLTLRIFVDTSLHTYSVWTTASAALPISTSLWSTIVSLPSSFFHASTIANILYDTAPTIRNIPNQPRDNVHVGHDEISYHFCNSL